MAVRVGGRMKELIKKRCGIASSVTVYDDDIGMYIEDCRADMKASGVPKELADSEEHPGVLTAITLYVKIYLGDDREDSEKYLQLYRNKVFRLSLEEGGTQCGMEVSDL